MQYEGWPGYTVSGPSKWPKWKWCDFVSMLISGQDMEFLDPHMAQRMSCPGNAWQNNLEILTARIAIFRSTSRKGCGPEEIKSAW